ncbi:MAG: hypothetical protein J1E81_07795 [Eubacterium sp.]|nr:hypothetical protein [Eubacterium sp.]
MTRTEFKRLLEQNGIDPNIVSFDNSVSEGYCLRKNHFRWETFIRERGIEYNLMGFPSESNALESLYERIVRIYRSDNMRIAMQKRIEQEKFMSKKTRETTSCVDSKYNKESFPK